MSRALAVLVTAAACQATPAIDERTSAVVGGAVDLADDAVVGITSRARRCGDAPEALCTGTLIAPRAVLTAAHCVDGESAATLVVFTGPRIDGAERVEIDAIAIHPDYNGLAGDLAILTLVTPLAQAPLPVRRAPIDPSQIGTRARVVGFGVGDDGMTGIKRQGTARLSALTATTLVLAPDPALTCNGDSGGPVLIAEEIAGVVAYGDPACTTSGTSTRADVHLDTFIAPALARIAASTPVSRPADATCTACDRAEDCARGADCVDGICAALGVPVSTLGAACSDDSTCGGAPCVTEADDGGCRCLVVCEPGGCGCRSSGGAGGTLLVTLLAAAMLRRSRSRARPRPRVPRAPT